jgi:hypothetical protein
LKDDYPLVGSAYDDDDDDDDDQWAGDDTAWTEEQENEEETDGKDESSAYLAFLNEEAAKFGNLDDEESDDELGEESLLETPLDKLEPYQLFRDALLSTLTTTVAMIPHKQANCTRSPAETTSALRNAYHKPHTRRKGRCPERRTPSRSNCCTTSSRESSSRERRRRSTVSLSVRI